MVFVAFVDELVRARDELEVVDVIELCKLQLVRWIPYTSTNHVDRGNAYLSRNLIPKQPPCSPWTYCPSLHLLRIAPHQVTERSFVRNLLRSSNHSNLIQGPDLRTQPTMNAENLPINNGCQCKEVKDLTARFPHRGVAVFLLAFFVEAVDLRDLAGFVVAAHERDFVGISVATLVSAQRADWKGGVNCRTLPSNTSTT